METRESLEKIAKQLSAENLSPIILTLNSKLNFNQAKLIGRYKDWKKI